MLRRFRKQVFPWLYQQRALPGPGVENVAFLSEWLAPVTPCGAGVQNSRQFWFQTPTTVQSHLVGVQGIGGLIHGQFYMAPLADVQNNYTG